MGVILGSHHSVDPLQPVIKLWPSFNAGREDVAVVTVLGALVQLMGYRRRSWGMAVVVGPYMSSRGRMFHRRTLSVVDGWCLLGCVVEAGCVVLCVVDG